MSETATSGICVRHRLSRRPRNSAARAGLFGYPKVEVGILSYSRLECANSRVFAHIPCFSLHLIELLHTFRVVFSFYCLEILLSLNYVFFLCKPQFAQAIRSLPQWDASRWEVLYCDREFFSITLHALLFFTYMLYIYFVDFFLLLNYEQRSLQVSVLYITVTFRSSKRSAGPAMAFEVLDVEILNDKKRSVEMSKNFVLLKVSLQITVLS